MAMYSCSWDSDDEVGFGPVVEYRNVVVPYMYEPRRKQRSDDVEDEEPADTDNGIEDVVSW